MLRLAVQAVWRNVGESRFKEMIFFLTKPSFLNRLLILERRIVDDA